MKTNHSLCLLGKALLALIVTATMLQSCKKDNGTGIADCYLSRTISADAYGNPDTTTFVYSNSRLVMLLSSNPNSASGYDTTMFRYNSDGYISSYGTSNYGVQFQYGTGQFTSQQYIGIYSGDTLKQVYTYSNGEVTNEAEFLNNNLQENIKYLNYVNGNVTLKETVMPDGTVVYREYLSYDNNKRLDGFPLSLPISWAQNNVVKDSTVGYNQGSPNPNIYVYTYTYAFDASGNPTQKITFDTQLGASFETDIAYTCQ